MRILLQGAVGGLDIRAPPSVERPCSSAKRFDELMSRCRPREILLASDEVTVADRKRTPEAGLHIVRANAFQLVFDSPGHHVPVARQEIHLPNSMVSKVFFNIGKPGDRLASGQVLAVRKACVLEDGDPRV